MDEIENFWEAFYEIFSIQTSNSTCGSHVHISPIGRGFEMGQLQRIAYAVIIYERHILEILSEANRKLDFCKPNTEVSPALMTVFKNGRNQSSYTTLKREIQKLQTRDQLCNFMQGKHNRSKYVLWNFQNLQNPDKNKETIEFRGIPGVHSDQETIHWILFAVGFVLLAEEEVCHPMDHFVHVGYAVDIPIG